MKRAQRTFSAELKAKVASETIYLRPILNSCQVNGTYKLKISSHSGLNLT
jgi:hypothetical protein